MTPSSQGSDRRHACQALRQTPSNKSGSRLEFPPMADISTVSALHVRQCARALEGVQLGGETTETEVVG